MDVHGGFGAAGDAALVEAARGGDRAAFAQIYDRYADRLHDFCWSLLRNREEAADATHDAFVLAAERLGQLRDPSRLRPWLYAVARSQALRRLRARDRMIDKDGEQEMAAVADPGAGPEGVAEQADLQRLVWDAVAGLGERDQSLLDLHLRQGLEGAELGEAMGVDANHAYVLLTRVRDQVERSLGALLVARMGRDDCAELARVLEGWDGRFSPLIRKRVARHVDGCDACGDRRRTMVSPLALLSAVPLMPAPTGLRDHVLASVTLPGGPPADSGGQGGQARAARGAGPAGAAGGPAPAGVGGGTWPPGGGPPPPDRARASKVAVLGLVALLAVVVGGVAAVVIPDLAASGQGSQVAAGLGTTVPPTTEEPPTSTGEETTTTEATTTTAPPTTAATTITTSTSAPTTTTTVVPLQLGVSPKAITLGPNSPRGVITLTNPGRVAVAWEAVAVSSNLWFAIDPTGGTIKPGGKATIVASYNPTAVKPPAQGSVLVVWNGGQASVSVTLPLPQRATTTVPGPPTA